MASTPEKQLTPMMAQYQRIKRELPPDALLLFRLGDFYEMFFEDAQTGAQLLNVALTKRGLVPMCGIPFHAANSYISKILKAGRKVAICEQVSEPKPGQIVQREVTQILSPGTHFDERMLQAERNNYLAAVYQTQNRFGLALIDLTTADFKVTELTQENELLTELDRCRPAEIIYPAETDSLPQLLKREARTTVASPHEGWVFAPETSIFTLQDHFNVATLDGFGLKDKPAATGAAGGALHYLSQHLRRDVSHLTRITCYQAVDFLILDSVTLRNLEILEPLRRDAPKSNSLYGSLNRTVTPMGARRLRDWLTQPLSSIQAIQQRQQCVQLLLAAGPALDDLRQHLREIRDLERTVSRLSVGSGNARDLVALKLALHELPAIKQILQQIASAPHAPALHDEMLLESAPRPEPQTPASLLHELETTAADFPDLVQLLGAAIVDEPPLAVKEGGIIRDGYHSDLDELRQGSRDGKDWIARLQQEETARTGITSLKIRYNSVFGYYIEVTKANLNKVPDDYIRKQTVANAERFITPKLKEMEGKILGAEERSSKLEYEIFLKIRESVMSLVRPIQDTAQALAQIDVLTALAETARLFHYCQPLIQDQGALQIREGRHPILDQTVTSERFVPNDTELDVIDQQITLITGPNMAGKSTYIRQVALLVLLAHTGSFIPATSARIDLVDRIFTRIGASDDLSRGQSTFMVEMSETANILNNATQRSLVILDEIGRGTSTFDGLSLAWAIVECLHNQVGAKTLFATHYHELTELAGRLPRIKNYNVAVREWNDQIIFLRKIVPGGTDKSYGVQVARLAGIPKPVITRAKEILSNLEQSELAPEGKPRRSNRHRAERETLKSLSPPPQLDLFS